MSLSEFLSSLLGSHGGDGFLHDGCLDGQGIDQISCFIRNSIGDESSEDNPSAKKESKLELLRGTLGEGRKRDVCGSDDVFRRRITKKGDVGSRNIRQHGTTASRLGEQTD
jgi:hypothetical protein